MQVSQEVDGALEDPYEPPPVKRSKPGFMSKDWFMDILKATLMWKYSPREWGIFNLSAWINSAQWVTMLIVTGVWTKASAMLFVKNMWLKFVAILTAIVEVLFNW